MVLCYDYQINFFYINYMYSFGKVGRKGVSNFKLAWKRISAISPITFLKRALKISGPIILKILSKYRMCHCQIYLYSLLYNITTKNWKNFKIIFLKKGHFFFEIFMWFIKYNLCTFFEKNSTNKCIISESVLS